jgi:hypothetical protein
MCLTITLLVVLLMHVVIAVVFVFGPRTISDERVKLYKGFTHIGPFFTIRNLTSSYHVIVDIKKADGNSEHIDLTDSLFTDFYSNPWKYHQSLKKDYLRQITGALGIDLRLGASVSSEKSQRLLRQMSTFIKEEIALKKGDSVHCGFLWKTFLIEDEKYKVDTLFYLPIAVSNDR